MRHHRPLPNAPEGDCCKAGPSEPSCSEAVLPVAVESTIALRSADASMGAVRGEDGGQISRHLLMLPNDYQFQQLTASVAKTNFKNCLRWSSDGEKASVWGPAR